MDWIDEQLRTNEIDYGRVHARITKMLREHFAAKGEDARILRPQFAVAKQPARKPAATKQRSVKPIDAEQLFLANLVIVDRAISYVCHRNRIGRDEGEEFGSYVKFKLIEANYAIIRKFEGRSSFSTYVTTVIQRMFFQYRVQMWGKWRPSPQARRLGDKGITVERLLTREGFTYAETMAILTSGHEPRFTVAEIEAIYARLPERRRGPVLVSGIEKTNSVPLVDTEDELFSSERAKTAQSTAAVIDAAIATMAAEDQLILRMRFWGGRKVTDIGHALGLESKKLYKRIERLLSQLRLALEQEGIAAADARELLNHADHELSFAFSTSDGNAEFRHSASGDSRGGAAN
jgi:RNA polymerase sigma factor (sigma-70 family)